MQAHEDIALALDPARMFRALRDAKGNPALPDEWQAELLRNRPKEALLLCTRQAGKSTVTAAAALHEALFFPGSLVLLLSPSLRQSVELYRKVSELYQALGRPVEATVETTQRLELKNGSRVISLPGKEETIRGFSGVRLLIIDEAARVPDDLYFSVRPMLAVSNGRIIALTTPFGKRGFFFNEWTEGGSSWERHRITAYDCPRISTEFLESERRALGVWWFEQEYLCEYKDTVDSLFRYDDIMNAFSDEVEALVL